jgi:peroxiredoxin Q/BCP
MLVCNKFHNFSVSILYRPKNLKIMKRAIMISIPLLAFAMFTCAQAKLGEKVPNFTALDHEGSEWVLKKQIKDSEYLVVYFYPAAFTGGCTKQACAYRDQKGDLAEVGAQVVGVSGDKPETLNMFAYEHQLNFTLLADESGDIAKLFGVPQNDGGTIQREIDGRNWDLARGTTIQRWTFILDQKRKLIYQDAEVNAVEDSGRVIEFLSSLKP